MQTLAIAIERLTQCNQELEQQLNQRNERRLKDQCDKCDNNEQNGSHLPMGDLLEREDQEESNVPNRRDRPEDTNYLSEIEISAMRMAQDR